MDSTDREREELDAQEIDVEQEVDDAQDVDAAEDNEALEDIEDVEEAEEVLVAARPRSAPRYGAFIGAGIIVGIVLALVLFLVLPSDGSSSSLTGLIYLAILVTPLTALLGGLAAVLFERRSLRK